MTIRQTFGAELEKELTKIGFNLEGHYPLLKTMFYTLDVDFEHNKVGIWYGPEQAKLTTCKLSAPDVADSLRRWHKQITHDSTLSDEAFIKVLYTIVGDQERMSIPDLVSGYIKRIGTMSKKTARIFLSYDLYRLKTRIVDGDELSLVTATRAYTQRKSDFLWIPTDDRGHGNYISHIRFRRIHSSVSDIKSDIDAAVKKETA
jgi:uncharacterized ubiquitin-like protein YukD